MNISANVERGERVIVGVNRFAQDEGADDKVPVFRIDPAMERARIEAVRELRATRDAEAWKCSLSELEAAARGTQNLMPAIVAAVGKGATVGEISDTLRKVFGEYRDRA